MTAAIKVDDKQRTNGAKETIDLSRPYTALVTLQGIAPMLMHRWNVEAVEEKSKAAKGSKGKKTDDLESYVYRTDEGHLGLPGVNFHACLCEAAKFYQDPRSPRKSLRDLAKAAIIAPGDVVPFAGKLIGWDYEDKRRVTVQRNGITRTRPALKEGWRITFEVTIALPEYMPEELLGRLVTDAGRLIGLGDFRPTYGRFVLAGLETV